MIVIFAALLAGALGNVVQRAWFGPTGTERQRAAALVKAQQTNDTAEADRLLAAGAVDVGPREMAFTMVPFVGVLAGYGIYLLVTRPRRPHWPA
jgi:hypothetical protein